MRESGVLRWGTDIQAGGPYAYQDQADPNKIVGFEVDLAAALAKQMGLKSQMYQGSWPSLLLDCDRGDCDVVISGYEYTDARATYYQASIPYYIYELELLVKKGNSQITTWESLSHPPPGETFTIGVLTGARSATYLKETFSKTCLVREYDSDTSAMALTVLGQIDATVQDSCSALFNIGFLGRYPELQFAKGTRSPGYYVIYAKKRDKELIDALNVAIRELFESGQLQQIYTKYGIWNESQTRLPEVWKDWHSEPTTSGPSVTSLMETYLPQFLSAASMTVLLATCSMPIAVLLGLAIALVRTKGRGTGFPGVFPERVYGIPMGWIRLPFTVYVELIRGTPLLFQLYIVFFMLPSIGIELNPFWAGVMALAVNYSAYEAEIFRLGLQAIPKGQLEAAIALGMSRPLAVRRIIIPQAVRLVIPATANDFISLFKDTAVCSVIAVTELSKEFTIAFSATNQFLLMAGMTSVLYLLMSYPLSRLAAWLEHRLAPDA